MPTRIVRCASALIVPAIHAVTPLEPEEIDLIYDLVMAALLLTPLTNAVRAKETPDEPNYMAEYGEAGVQVCAAIQDASAAHAFTDMVRAACGLPAAHPHAPSKVDALIERRKATMGSRLYVFYDPPLHMVRGEGVWLTDAGGRRYLDCYNNVPHVGHCHPQVVEALTRQIRTLNTNTRYLGEQVLDYSERLGATLPGKLKVCAFVNSGSEANDIAWRMAKAYTRQCRRPHAGIRLSRHYRCGGCVLALRQHDRPDCRRMRTLLAPDGYRGQHRLWHARSGPAICRRRGYGDRRAGRSRR